MAIIDTYWMLSKSIPQPCIQMILVSQIEAWNFPIRPGLDSAIGSEGPSVVISGQP